jgi:hypothetical protein
VVRRLVKRQNIGRRREYAGKRGTARLAAGQRRRVPVAAEAELFQVNRQKDGRGLSGTASRLLSPLPSRQQQPSD